MAWAATSPSEWPEQPSTPGHSSPANQHSRPTSIGWTSVPIPIRLIPGPATAVGDAQVPRMGDLERLVRSVDHHDPAATRLDQGGVVGDARRCRRAPPPAPLGEPLRCLYRPQVGAVHRGDDDVTGDPLDRCP